MSGLLELLPLKEPTLLEPGRLAWLVGALGVVLLASLGLIGRTRALRRFFDQADAGRFARLARDGSAIARLAATGVAIGLVVVALARPAHDPKPRAVERAGRDVVFAIDVSRSMLAQDLRPNRLERAKLAVGDVLDVLQGDRVGIVAFAGTSVLKSPLTSDYAFARMQLEDLTPDSVSRGGTAIGDAIRGALAILFADVPRGEKAPARSRTIFVLTDGEDTASDPEGAARLAAERGVRVVTVGLGSEGGALVPAAPPGPATGAVAPPPVPDASQPGSFMSFQGEPVRSKLNFAALRTIAEITPGGAAINVGTGNVELDRVYQLLMRSSENATFGTQETKAYTELFQWVLALALAAMGVEVMIHARSRAV